MSFKEKLKDFVKKYHYTKKEIDELVLDEINNLSYVAKSGSYSDLYNKPNLFSGNYNDLTNKPTLSNFVSNENEMSVEIEYTDGTTETLTFIIKRD